MSGGHFDYKQYQIKMLAEELEEMIESQGKEKEDLYSSKEWYEEFPEDKFNRTYPDEINEKFKEGLDLLKKAYIYAQRIDWLLSGDDGEASFLRRLEEDLNDLSKEE